ncbi:hypothetical protein PIB30_056961 [Stylosanthes scabra]|uniref:Uncharacterized protein n=1 Tax=Stylosanthes scabra TaxID=79078 RepID=A0ABU6XHH9_9FABA|nr:hypothetical protein [Stylosanthes scabra]
MDMECDKFRFWFAFNSVSVFGDGCWLLEKMGKKIESVQKPSSSKNQGHLFRCLPTTVATMFDYLNKHPDKRALVDQMGFGALSHLPNNNLDQVLLKHLFDRYDIYDNTIYSDAAAMKITTKKIGDALGLSSNGISYDTRVVRKKLSPEDQVAHKFFQGMTTVALQDLIKSTPLDTDDNWKLFMRSFICFIQKGLLKTVEMRAKKDNLQKKRTKRDAEDSESESESHQSSSTHSKSESSSSLDSDADAGHDVHEEPPHEQEVRSKKRNDPAVVGSNEPLIITQQSVAMPEFSQSEDTPLAVAFENIRKRKKQQRGDRNTKKKLSQINEGDETRMFDTFDTVSLGGDDSGNVVVQGPIVVPSQPFNKENDPIQPEQPSKSHSDEVGVPPHIVENALPEEIQPEPLDVIISALLIISVSGLTTCCNPVEPELTLRPWLQAKADTSAAKGPLESPDEVITHVLLSMNQEGPSTQGGEQTKDEDQCKTPETAP